MPRIYLSPSTQEWNLYINGGTEEYYMNLVADAMEPYLLASGISFTRNTPDMTAASSIAASNNGDYDAHVSLHSNAAPEALSTAYIITRPLSSISILTPVSSMILLIIFPPGPITSRILSVLI